MPGLVGFLVAAAVTSRLGFETGILLPEGQALPVESIGTAGLVSVKSLGFSAPRDANGRFTDFATDLAVYQGGREIARKTIRVNDPLETAGYTFHQNFFGPAVDPALHLDDGVLDQKVTILLVGARPGDALAAAVHVFEAEDEPDGALLVDLALHGGDDAARPEDRLAGRLVERADGDVDLGAQLLAQALQGVRGHVEAERLLLETQPRRGVELARRDRRPLLAVLVRREVEEAVRTLEAATGFPLDAPFEHVLGTKHEAIERQRAEFLAARREERHG
jgi:hypothetical protein